MNKYYKTIILASALAVLGPLQALAANDVTLDAGGNAIITVGGINLTLSPAAMIDSIEVGSDSFTATLSTNGSISVVSTDRRLMTFSQPGGQSQLTTTLTCTTADSTYTIGNPTPGATNMQITATPSASTCSTSGGGSGSSGSGSTTGGGGGGNPYAAVATPAVVVPAVSVTPAVVTTPAPSSAGGVSALATLKVGQSNPLVKVVQIILNLNPSTKIASAGAGSPGKETTVFGGLTLKAIQKLQVANGIKASDPEYGKLGQKTMLSLIQILVDKVAVLQAELAKQKALGN